jgi:hypothetical protein
MEHIFIQDLLKKHEISLNEINLGEFDYIGEYTAKKMRDQNDPLFSKVGAFFRPNYERAILIYSLIKKYKLRSYLEIGFGRGLSAIAAAKAMHDLGNDGKVFSIDIKFDENQLKLMQQVFPQEWLQRLTLVNGSSQEMLPQVFSQVPNFDFIYVDGDHRAPAVQADWDATKEKWNNFLLFDDYHLPTKKEADIECAQVIDKIDSEENDFILEGIFLDRRIFVDDRRIPDDQLDYCQVLLTKKKMVNWLNEW